MSLWTLHEIQKALNLPEKGENFDVSGVSIDSRTVETGDVFVALLGNPSGGFSSAFENAGDGHDYVKKAEKNGAVCAIVQHKLKGVTIPQLVVDDTLMHGLWQLAKVARIRTQATVIGVTGSCGKTTTKEFLLAGLNAHGPVESYNNFWGVPLTLARMPPNCTWAVIEMGMNQKGEIARLATLAKPDVALITNVEPVHLQDVGTLEDIRTEKCAIVEGLTENGVLVVEEKLNISDVKWQGKVVTFSDTDKGDVYVVDVKYSDKWTIKARCGEENVSFQLSPGSPARLQNSLAALAAAYAAKANIHNVVREFATVGVMPGRGTVHTVGGITVIDDSFNGNPASVAMALENLKVFPATRRFAILGDMLELGKTAPQLHAGLVKKCVGLDGVICVGDLMAHLYEVMPKNIMAEKMETCADISLEDMVQNFQKGDVVLIKGSKKIFWVHDFAVKLQNALQSCHNKESQA